MDVLPAPIPTSEVYTRRVERLRLGRHNGRTLGGNVTVPAIATQFFWHVAGIRESRLNGLAHRGVCSRLWSAQDC